MIMYISDKAWRITSQTFSPRNDDAQKMNAIAGTQELTYRCPYVFVCIRQY